MKNRKINSLFLFSLIFLFLSFAFFSFGNNNQKTEFWGEGGNFYIETTTSGQTKYFQNGSGSPDDPYQISNEKEMGSFSYVLNSNDENLSSYKTASYVIVNSLDMSEKNWKSVESFNASLTSLSNTTLVGINAPLTEQIASGGVVENVIILDSSLSVTADYAGMIAKKSSGTIKNCYVDAIINANGKNYVGGIVGEQAHQTAELSGLTFVGEIKNGGDNVGGIAGQSNSAIKNCLNKAKITGNEYVGGIVGYATCQISKSFNYGEKITGNEYVGGITGINSNKISFCMNNSNLSAYRYAGGIVGEQNASIISDCFNKGNFNSGSASYVGGIVGHVNGNTTISSCFNSANIGTNSTMDYIGGLIGKADNNGSVETCLTINKSFNSGTIKGNSNIGGLIGGVEESLVLDNVYNNGSVQGYGDYVGGLAGNCKNTAISGVQNRVTINKSFNSAIITANSSMYGKYIGGLIGYISTLKTMTSSFNLGDVYSNSHSAGIVGQYICNNFSSTQFSFCFNIGEINSGDYSAGFIGSVEYRKSNEDGSDKKLLVFDCFSYGKVKVLNESNYASKFIGGFLPELYSSQNTFRGVSFLRCECNGWDSSSLLPIAKDPSTKNLPTLNGESTEIKNITVFNQNTIFPLQDFYNTPYSSVPKNAFASRVFLSTPGNTGEIYLQSDYLPVLECFDSLGEPPLYSGYNYESETPAKSYKFNLSNDSVWGESSNISGPYLKHFYHTVGSDQGQIFTLTLSYKINGITKKVVKSFSSGKVVSWKNYIPIVPGYEYSSASVTSDTITMNGNKTITLTYTKVQTYTATFNYITSSGTTVGTTQTVSDLRSGQSITLSNYKKTIADYTYKSMKIDSTTSTATTYTISNSNIIVDFIYEKTYVPPSTGDLVIEHLLLVDGTTRLLETQTISDIAFGTTYDYSGDIKSSSNYNCTNEKPYTFNFQSYNPVLQICYEGVEFDISIEFQVGGMETVKKYSNVITKTYGSTLYSYEVEDYIDRFEREYENYYVDSYFSSRKIYSSQSVYIRCEVYDSITIYYYKDSNDDGKLDSNATYYKVVYYKDSDLDRYMSSVATSTIFGNKSDMNLYYSDPDAYDYLKVDYMTLGDFVDEYGDYVYCIP